MITETLPTAMESRGYSMKDYNLRCRCTGVDLQVLMGCTQKLQYFNYLTLRSRKRDCTKGSATESEIDQYPIAVDTKVSSL